MADKQVIESLRKQVAAVAKKTQTQKAKLVVGETESVMFPPALYWQIENFAPQALEVLEGSFDKRKKRFTTNDGKRKFAVRAAYWAEEIH